jgi:hypothetical protein
MTLTSTGLGSGGGSTSTCRTLSTGPSPRTPSESASTSPRRRTSRWWCAAADVNRRRLKPTFSPLLKTPVVGGLNARAVCAGSGRARCSGGPGSGVERAQEGTAMEPRRRGHARQPVTQCPQPAILIRSLMPPDTTMVVRRRDWALEVTKTAYNTIDDAWFYNHRSV